MVSKLKIIIVLVLFFALINGCIPPKGLYLDKLRLFVPEEQELNSNAAVKVKYPIEDRYLDLWLNLSEAGKLKIITAIREGKLKGEIVVKEPDGTELARQEIKYFQLQKRKNTIISETFDQIKNNWIKVDSFAVDTTIDIKNIYSDTAAYIPQEIYVLHPDTIDVYRDINAMVYISLSYMDVKQDTLFNFATVPKLIKFPAQTPPPDSIHEKIKKQLTNMGWSKLAIQKVIAICDTLRNKTDLKSLKEQLADGDSLFFSISNLVQFIPDSLKEKQLPDSAKGYRMKGEFVVGEYDINDYPFMKEAVVAISAFINYVVEPFLNNESEYELRLTGFSDEREVQNIPNEFDLPVFYYSNKDFNNYLDRRIYYKTIRAKNVLLDGNDKLKKIGNKILDNFQLSQARSFSVFSFIKDYMDEENIDLKYSLVGYGIDPEIEKAENRRRADIIFKLYK